MATLSEGEEEETGIKRARRLVRHPIWRRRSEAYHGTCAQVDSLHLDGVSIVSAKTAVKDEHST